ncbi:MAG: AMP-binding protein, partial [Thermoleophilia bacterium]|nr:AMP-binding protein [Thermoleophilia bacterium]
MSDDRPTIEALQVEERIFPPPADLAAAANAKADLYERAAADPEAFWAEEAQALDWIEPWEQVVDRSNHPFYKWFVGGKLNASVNCLDRHLATRADKVAFHWEGEPGDTQAITYADLHERVCRLANGLRSLGVGRGERVAIYMGMVPELPI